MTTTKKKTDTVYDARPGDVVVIAEPDPNSQHIFVRDDALRRSFTDAPSYALRPGVVYLLPQRVFRAGSDQSRMLDEGKLHLVDETRGCLPEVIDSNDSHVRALFRDGRRPRANWQERIQSLRNTWIADTSVCEAVLGLEDAGWLLSEAQAELERIYRHAFVSGLAPRRPWIERAIELLEAKGIPASTCGFQGVAQYVREKKSEAQSGPKEVS